jgi:hypothetical protein
MDTESFRSIEIDKSMEIHGNHCHGFCHRCISKVIG